MKQIKLFISMNMNCVICVETDISTVKNYKIGGDETQGARDRAVDGF